MCVAEDGTIGDKGTLPWHLPADLKRFKSLTSGSTMIMGRKTHESISRSLPNRQNIILSSDVNYQTPGCDMAPNLETAFDIAKHDTIFIIGGVQLFKAAASVAEYAYITYVHASYDGDTKYIYDFTDWQLMEIKKYPKDSLNSVPYSFATYKRL